MFIPQFRLKTFVQRVLCEAQSVIDFAAFHPVREMQKLALQETVEYVRTNMGEAIGVFTPRQLIDLALRRVDVDGHYLEFGVFRGGTIRYLASRRPAKTIFGFDSFEGLPDAWTGYDKDRGTFSLGGRLPRVPRNVVLQPGWFDVSLPSWLSAYPGPIAFVHIDCDLYASTKTVFDLLGPRLGRGTVIVFDEYFGYPNWQQHEFRAFREFVSNHCVEYEYLGYSRIQAAVRLLSAPRALPAAGNR